MDNAPAYNDSDPGSKPCSGRCLSVVVFFTQGSRWSQPNFTKWISDDFYNFLGTVSETNVMSNEAVYPTLLCDTLESDKA